MSNPQPPPHVVVHVPGGLGPIDILVRHEYGEVKVDIRSTAREAWQPIRHAGGSFSVRPV